MDRFLAGTVLVLTNCLLFILAALVDLLADSGNRGLRPVLFIAIAIWTMPALVALYRSPFAGETVLCLRLTAAVVGTTWLAALLAGLLSSILVVRLHWSAGLLADLCIIGITLVEGWSLSRRLSALPKAAGQRPR